MGVTLQSSLERTVDPTTEPLEIEDVKTHLGYDGRERDQELKRLIESARETVEEETERAIIQQTWVLRLDCFPSVIELRRPPISSVSSITYLDSDDVSQTLATTVYDTDLKGSPGRIALADGQSWPTTRTEMNAVTVTFVAGYGTAATDVPQRVKSAMMLLIEQEFFGVQADPRLQGAIDALLGRLRWNGQL